MIYFPGIRFQIIEGYSGILMYVVFPEKNVYICMMKKIQKDIITKPFNHPDTERKFILNSMVDSFRIEGISISEKCVQAVYTRVSEKLKKQMQ